jgi:hypothetical protein
MPSQDTEFTVECPNCEMVETQGIDDPIHALNMFQEINREDDERYQFLCVDCGKTFWKIGQ